MTPLGNFLAIREPDATRRAALLAQISRDGFDDTAEWGTWVVAERAVGGRSDPGAIPLAQRRLMFAEGRAAVVGAPERADSWQRAAERFVTAPDGLRGLDGDFTGLHIDTRDRAFVARCVSGRSPVYVRGHAERTAISTQLTLLARYSRPPLSLDPWAIALHMETFLAECDGAVLANVRVVRPGWCASTERSLQPAPYWDPRSIETARPSRSRHGEHAERLRAGVLANLASELDDRSLLGLSGGVDSSCLAVLAAASGRRFATFTFLPPDPRDQSRERMWLSRVRGEIANRVTVSKELVLTPERRLSLLESAPRVVVPFRHPALAMLAELAREAGATTVTGGEGADELFGSITVNEDWMSTTRPRDLLRIPASVPFVAARGRHLARFVVRRRLRRVPLPLPTQIGWVFAPELATRYREWRARLAAALSSSSAPRPFLELRFAWLASGMAMHWEVCSALNVARAFPFVSRELVELAFEAHPLESLGPGGKRLVRRAFDADVPRSVMARRDKGQSRPGTPGPVAWKQALPDELLPIVRPGLVAGSSASQLPAWEALRLRALVNIVEALRNERDGHERA